MPERDIKERWREAAHGREDQIEAAGESFRNVLRLMAHLRSADGCPWDREQSLASLRQYVREEADEVCQAIDQILALEDTLRARHGLGHADSAPPAGEDRARTEKKGLAIAHHPHREDFDPAVSASGAPLPSQLTPAEQRELDALYLELHKELGDLMLQPVFQGDILEAMGRPGAGHSLELLIAKLIHRHPHVYGDRQVADSAEVLRNWEEIKRDEGTSSG